ncbi:hypothetical protein GCM10011344_47930 [Dokdonia pacifica]|nr:hypothetical protein GCM10011344_47930 [Dokdonia pacifica]
MVSNLICIYHSFINHKIKVMLEKFRNQEVQKPQAIYGGKDIVIEDDVILLKADIVVDDIIDGA